MRRSPLVLVFALLIAAPAFAQAPPADQDNAAQARLERARRRLDNAGDRLRGLIRQRNALADDGARLEANRSTVTAQANEAQGALGPAESAAAQAKAAIEAARGNVEVIKADIRTFTERAKARRAALLEEFKASPEMLAAERKLKDAQAKYEAAANVVRERLSRDPKHAARRKAADQLRAEVESLRSGGSADPATLTAKSQQWMTAQSEIGKIETDAIAADPAAQAAAAVVADAETAQRALIAAHEKSFSSDPELAALERDREAAARALAAAQDEIRDATDAQKDALAKLAAGRRALAAAQAAQRELEKQLQDRDRDVNGLDDLIRLAELEVARARNEYDAARRAVNNNNG